MNIRVIQGVTQTLLVVSIVYFAVCVSALAGGRSLDGLDRPLPFIAAVVMLLGALGMRLGMAWWRKRHRLAWSASVLLSYVVIGFAIAPALFGDAALIIAMLFPLGAVFVLGFAFVYAALFRRAMAPHTPLSAEEIRMVMPRLAGWGYAANGMEKTYRFKSYGQALQFAMYSGTIAQSYHREPTIELCGSNVCIRMTVTGSGLTHADVRIARKIDRI